MNSSHAASRGELFKGFVREIPGLMGEKPILTALIFLIIIGFIVFRITISSKQEGKEFTGNIIAEGYGVVFDIFVFGILIALFNRLGEKRRDIKRWKEEIDDYRFWENEEAKFRIVGNINRLNKAGVSNIDLSHSCLQEALLWGANLRGANLEQADLREANLEEADLKGANLGGANLKGALLFLANLEEADLREAYLEGADLGEANLKEASLNLAYLEGALLFGANLEGANLRRAILNDTYLKKGINLSLNQLSKVETLFRAKLDPELEAQVKENYPHLLEEPKEDK